MDVLVISQPFYWSYSVTKNIETGTEAEMCVLL